mgnify:CR=1 FL=1
MAKQQFRVRFSEPEPENLNYAQEVLNLTYLHDCTADDELLSTGQRRRRLDNSAQALKVLNGDWRSTIIVHHCKLGCCKNKQDFITQDAK